MGEWADRQTEYSSTAMDANARAMGMEMIDTRGLNPLFPDGLEGRGETAGQRKDTGC